MPRRANGQGSIYQRAGRDGWTGAVSINGRQRTKTFDTKREAQRWIERTNAELAAGVAGDDRLTLGAYLDRWLEQKKGTVEASTHVRYSELANVHVRPALGGIPLGKLTPGDVHDLMRRIQASGRSATTARRCHTLLHSALKQAMREGLIVRNVAELADAPRPSHHEMRPFDVEESRRFVGGIAGDPLEALYLLALTTGAREGELFALRWGDLDVERRTWMLRRKVRRVTGLGRLEGPPKTRAGNRRVILLPPVVAALPQGHRPADGLVFPTSRGTAREPQNFLRREFYPLLERLQLRRIHFHDLRHGTATLLLALDVHPSVVQRILGHADVTTTLRVYSHVLPGLDEAAMAQLERLLMAPPKSTTATTTDNE